MLLRTITLANSGNVCLDGGGYILALGYECNRGIYQLQLRPTGEWDGLTIRACWHLPDGTSTTTLAVDGYVDVPATVTALPGTGCITFEGAAEGKTITSSDLRYLVGDNSGVEDGTLPEPNTPAWEQLVGTVAESTAQAEEAADRADKAAAAAEGALTAVEGTASKALSDINAGKNTALEAITHRKEDALAAVDRAKTDATGDVQTAKQEAVAAITHTGTDQIQAVTRAGEQAVQEVDAAAQAGVGRVEQAQQTATQAVQTAATAAIQRVEQTGSTQVQAVTAAGAGQVKKIEDAAAEKLEGITRLAGQAADSATKAEQAAQRAEDAAAATNAIIDDTAITPDKTWSSLRILDTLCPPIKATGNPVVCHPVEGYPLGVTVNFAPIQEGEGDPSPENVRPIKAREAVDVTRCGVNMLDPELIEDAGLKPYGLTITHLGSGKVHIEGVYTKETPGGAFVILYTQQHILEGKALNIRSFVTKGSLKIDSTYGFRSRGENAIAINVSWEPGTAVDMDIVVMVSPKDITPSAFAPYTGQTATLTLPRTIYGGTVDAVTGEGQETWKLLTLDGTEPWADNGNIASRKEQQWALYGILGPYPGTFGISSHFDNIKGSQVYPFNFVRISANSLVFHVALDGPFATSDALKSYLAAQYAAGTPVQIAYKLATPTPITATGGKPIPALAGTNTLLTDGDSLTVTGRADPTHEIQQLRAAVVALGGTI